jgi:hypothetical protein
LGLKGPFENFGQIKGILGRLQEDLKKKEAHTFIAYGIPTLSTTQ